MVLSVVVLPAPLAPMSVTISPVVHGQGDAPQGVDAAVVGVEVGDLEQGHGQAESAAAAAAAGAVPPRRLAQVGFDDALVALDLGWRALGDALTVVEDGDALGDAHHHAHLVLDEEDA